jgi:hypothetical protein
MRPSIYYESKTGDHFKLTLMDQSPVTIDTILDQLNLCVKRFLQPGEYRIQKPFKIDITNPEGNQVLAELECEDIYSEENAGTTEGWRDESHAPA